MRDARAPGRSPAHGFGDDEQTRRLLRSRPPRQALAWAGSYLGGRVVAARALRGGMSSAVHLVWERAVEISRGPAPNLPVVLLHRDFHPGHGRTGRVRSLSCPVPPW